TVFDASTGAFTYAPNANFFGADSFSFTVSDGSLTSPAATVDITVTANDDAPVASDASHSTDEDTPLHETLSGFDVEGETLSFSIIDAPTNGSVTLTDAETGAFTYTPAADFFGSDSFTFVVSAGGQSSNVGTINLTVRPINDAPVAIDDAFALDEDTSTVRTLPATDVEGDDLSFAIATPP